MTPDAWFAAIDPNLHLDEVDPRPVFSDGAWQAPPPRPSPVYRRLRLFATACARMVWQFLSTDARSAVSISERYADGQATDADIFTAFVRLRFGAITAAQHALNAAGNASLGSYNSNHGRSSEPVHLMIHPREAARSAAYALAVDAAGPAPAAPARRAWHNAWNAAFLAARVIQAEIARAVFPPPAGAARLEPDWLTSTVVSLARHIDQAGDYSLVPILADALQDAGCDSEPVLQCCRTRGSAFARGNWVVDFVLGR